MRILCCLTLALVPGLLRAAPAPEKDDKAVSAAESIRKALDRPVTVKIAKQPLGVAIDVLREKTGINIVLDEATIQQQLGFTPDQPPTPVDVDLKAVKAQRALRAVLAPYGLAYAILGDTVLVTTEDMAVQRQMRQRVNVDLDEVDLAAALRQVARESATNLILDVRVGKEAKAEVSLRADDVPLETAVRLLAEMAGLKVLRVGNTLFVTKKETAAEMRQDPDLAPPPAPGGVYGNVPAGLGALGGGLGALGGPVFVAPVAPNPPAPVPAPVPPTIPPAVGLAPAPPAAGPAPAPPAVGPAPVPTMGGTGAAPPPAIAPAGKVIEEETKPAESGKAPAPGKKEG